MVFGAPARWMLTLTGSGSTGSSSITNEGIVARGWAACQAEDLLAANRPVLLPLVGLTRMEHPEVTLPQVVAQIGQVQDKEMQQQLLGSLATLLPQKEQKTMVEQLIERLLEEDPDNLDTPFLQEVREKSEARGEARGIEVGEIRGRIETLLEVKFGEAGLALMPEIRTLRDVSILQAVRETLRTATTLEAVRAVYREHLPPPEPPAE